MISVDQIRAARLFLHLDQAQLAERSGVSLPTIQRLENANFGPPRSSVRIVLAVKTALEQAGIIFLHAENGLGEGVRLRRPGSEGGDRVSPVQTWSSVSGT